jgi:hypothetical protein
VDWLLTRPPTPRLDVLLEQAATTLSARRSVAMAVVTGRGLSRWPFALSKRCKTGQRRSSRTIRSELDPWKPTGPRLRPRPVAGREIVAKCDRLIATGRAAGLQQLPWHDNQAYFSMSQTGGTDSGCIF